MTRRRWTLRAIARGETGGAAAPLGLLGLFGVVAAVAVWQAIAHHAPTIFSDELETTQISRSVAATGHAARREIAYGFTSLVPWLTAPLWWIDSVSSAYEGIRILQALVMAAVVFPAYGIARFVVSRPWALAAAALSACTPALAYAPILKEEPFAYTASATAVFLLMRAAARPSWSTLATGLGGAVLATLVRTQLVVLVAVWAAALVVVAWRSEPLRRRRGAWTGIHRAAIALAVPAALALLVLLAAAASSEVRNATTDLRGAMWEYGIWALGAWAIGVGMLPAIAIFGALARPRASRGSRQVVAFTTVSGFTVVGFVAYAAVKAAAISAVLGPLIVERNLIYLTPLAAASAVCLLARRDAPWWALALSTGVVVFVVTRTPLELRSPYYESHGIAIMAWANIHLGWTASTIATVRWVVAVGAGVALAILCLPLRHRWKPGLPLATFLLAAALAWGIVAEIQADDGERRFAANFAARAVQPPDWIDRLTHGSRVTVLGQEMEHDPNDLWLTEFWNRGIVHVWSVDGTAPGPGLTFTPDLARTDGTLSANAGTQYALALPGIDLVGAVVAEMRGARLVRLREGVLRLRSSVTGIGEGGWTGPAAAFNRFVAPTSPAVAVLTLSRGAFCATVPTPSEVGVRIGRLEIGADHQPAIGELTAATSRRVTPCNTVTVELPVPDGPWRVEVTSDTFVPHDVDPSLNDQRQLGVQAALTTRPA